MVSYDLAVVGAGIVGLAHALAAARQGLRVVVIDRDAQPNGASIRNFGLVVVAGQEPGPARRHAERSRQIWLELSQAAGIEVVHKGLLVAAQRPQAVDLLDAFVASDRGKGCRMLTSGEVVRHQPGIRRESIVGGLFSPTEIRVESRDALPLIVAYLEQHHDVEFRFDTAVHEVAAPTIETSRGKVRAGKIVVCPGDDLATLFPDRIEAFAVRRCRLQMLRLAAPDLRLRSAVVSDLSLLRYGGFSQLPEALALQAVLDERCPVAIANGVHLIAVQSADGSLVVGDSHHYAATPAPFASEAVDRLIMAEFETLFGMASATIEARWTGTYASSSGQAYFRDRPEEAVRLVVITSGTGASTAFSIGEQTIAELFPH